VNGDETGWNYGLKSGARGPMSQDLNPCMTPVALDARSPEKYKLRFLLRVRHEAFRVKRFYQQPRILLFFLFYIKYIYRFA
jgi:hypothetical protein